MFFSSVSHVLANGLSHISFNIRSIIFSVSIFTIKNKNTDFYRRLDLRLQYIFFCLLCKSFLYFFLFHSKDLLSYHFSYLCLIYFTDLHFQSSELTTIIHLIHFFFMIEGMAVHITSYSYSEHNSKNPKYIFCHGYYFLRIKQSS